ncbi:MAG: response regulator transcription factor [Trueperaceae bacterium]
MSDAAPAAPRVLIADDHALFRAGVRAVLASSTGAEVVAEAETGAEAVERALETAPDVVLMDIQMPDMNGIEATRKILANDPRVGVIIVSMFEDDDSVFAAMRAGARGYVLKGAGQDEFLRAITAVANGEALYNPKIADRILTFFATSRRDLPLNVFPDLTEREREVLDLIAQGHPNAVIARRLSITDKTVRNHVTNIFSKLQVTDRVQAVMRARAAGFGQGEG